MIRPSLLALISLVAFSAHAQNTILPTTVSGGSGTVATIQANDLSSYSVAKAQTAIIGGFGAFGGAIHSVYLFVEYTPDSKYAGTGSLRINGVDTPIVPAAGDRTRSAFLDITGGAYGIDTSPKIASLSISFNNNGSGGQAGPVKFDYIYLVINPALPIHLPPTWSDEFEGSGPPDPANWVLEEGYQRNNELQYYMTSGNAWREGGNMVIEARREPMGGYDYTSASLRSVGKYSWKYGRAQIRAKIPALAGMWPAIWQVGDTGEWPSNGECDIMEFYNNKILANCAIGTSQRWVAKWFGSNKTMTYLEGVDSNWRTNWHIWTMQWDEDNVRLYCDNILMITVPQSSLVNPNGFEPFKQPHNIWLNLAVGGAGGDPSATTFPQRYHVDYWRVWEGYTNNSAPTDIQLSVNQLGEGLPVGTVVGALSVTDPDPAEVIRYTLVTGTGSTHNSQFSIPAFLSDSTDTLILKTNAILNYADGATRSIRVRATDIEGATFDKVLTINVTPLPQIEVSTTSLTVPEGGTNTFSVKLRAQPSDTVTVNVQRLSGDADLSVQSGATLNFTSANYAAWQTVTLHAAEDADALNGTATFQCSDADGIYTNATLTATEVDNDNVPPIVDAGPAQTLYFDPAGIRPPAVAGSSIFLDAGLDDGSNSIWEDSLAKWNVTLDSNVNYLANAGSALAGITAAYDFPGGLLGAGGGLGDSLDAMGMGKKPLTVELWFKPDASASYPSNGQILWETGGTTGLGIFYRNGVVEVAHDSNQGRISANVSTLTNEFIQVVTTYDPTSTVNNFKLYINGQLRVTSSRSDISISGSDASGLGMRGGSATGGAGSGDSNTTSFDGKIAMFRSYHDRILDGAGVAMNYRAIVPGVSYVLQGSVSDPDGGPVSTSWSVVSGPGPVILANAGAVDSVASFTAYGTYVLRLTANDGMNQVQDDVTLYVSENIVITPYESWAARTFANPFTNPTLGADSDGDGSTNLMEFAFGTDPTSGQSGPLEFIPGGEVTKPGLPVLRETTDPPGNPPFQAVFGRRKNHVAAGLTYTVEFSENLLYWSVSHDDLDVLSGEGGHEIEAVAVPFPANVPLSESGPEAPPRFFRVRVSSDQL